MKQKTSVFFDDTAHMIQEYVDTATGEITYNVVPCESIHCHRNKCRKSIYWEIVNAFDTVKQDYPYSTLITVNHIPLEHDSIKQVRPIIQETLAKKLGVEAKTISVVEPHSYPAVHVHCLVLSKKRFSSYLMEVVEQELKKILPVECEVDYSNRKSKNSSVRYLLKNFLKNPVRHLELNGDRVVSLSRSFWVNSRTAQKRNRRRKWNAVLARRAWLREQWLKARSELEHYYLDSMHVWELSDPVERKSVGSLVDVPLVMRI